MRPLTTILLAGIANSLVFASAFAANVAVPLKDGWRFVKADDPKIGSDYTLFAMSETLDCADRGDFSKAPAADWCAERFDDSAWTEVRVPHDWGVMKGFDASRPYGDGFLDVTGVGWYRRKFSVSVPEGGTVYFECDGAMSYAHVWVNGHFVGGWPYGYTRFRLDLTKFLHSGENTLAVRCHNVKDSSRWYTGGGLYRNCRLLVCPKDHIIPGSVAITTPEVTPQRANVLVRYRMSVSGEREKRLVIVNPHLWDISDPYLYTIDLEGNRHRFGIRTIAFHADGRGFQLNGRTVPLKGVCMHHDFGVLGAAWNKAAQKRRLLKFKEAGVNAIRSSHNPPDEGLLDLCDEMGLLVKDEAFDEWHHKGNAGKRQNGYHNIFDTWHERDLRAWVRTDRNHPCVILWSLGNEICDGHPKIAPHAEFVERARKLAAIVASEDATRPTTNANNNPINFTNDFPSVLGVMGCNYFPWQYPRLKETWPDVPFYGSETICSAYSRGEYTFPVEKRSLKKAERTSPYLTSYCWESCGWSNINSNWACPPDAQWHWMDQVKTCLGEFVWTGIDYLGGPYWSDEFRKNGKIGNPSLAIHACDTGFLDLAGFRKDAFYLFQSRWRPDLPMAHILPHWNWPEREGKTTPVYVFTTGDEAELFLNGRSLGRQKKQPDVWDRAYRLCWDDVKYVPGTLVAVAYRNGREWAKTAVRTTGEATALRLEPETRSIQSDGEDLCYVNVSVRDERGDVVPRTRNRVTFEVEGPGEIVATDNGDETNMDDFRQPNVRIFNGWAQAIVRARKDAQGVIRVTAKADGLAPASVEIACSGHQDVASVNLNGTWLLEAFPQPDDGAVRKLPLPKGLPVKAYKATVPGCCEMELVKSGELKDPLVGFNAFAFREYEGHQWLYRKRFVGPRRLSGEKTVLVFDGIDTLADVFLNGEKVGEAENMLIPHEFDVTGKIREDAENEVAVLIRPVGLAAQDVTLGELGRTMSGGADHEMFRKAPYMYGWDTMPHLAVSGIWRDVRLEIRPATRIDQPDWVVAWINRRAKTANVMAYCRIHAPFRHWYKAKVRTTISRNGKVCASSERPFRGAQFKTRLDVRNAEFWWPRGAGAQPLYDAKFELVGEDGEVLAENATRIGLRTVALEYDDRKLPERPGKFLFRINDEPIYVRGVDWIPLDPIPSRQAGLMKGALPLMAEVNANLVRVWGGGVYENEEFFDWCDENGVMVWQDFMTACAVPPQGDDFAAKFREEALSVVLRLRNRASLVLWAGDNENDQAASWGVGKMARDPNTHRITRETIPNVLKEYDVSRPYLPSSPYITREAFAKKVDPAEDHMWAGPRGWWKTKYYTDTPCWFCSEGGAHALPARSTLELAMGKTAVERPWKNPDVKDWSKLDWTDEWRYRATCPYLEKGVYPWHRNDIVLKQCAALFGDVPRHDVDLFIAQSQSAQAEAIKFQVENFRSQKFVGKGGFVVWNLRDGWPTISDAFTDSLGTRKKAFDAVRTAYQNVLVMVTEDGRLMALNETLKAVKGRVKVVEAKDGKTVFEGQFAVGANGREEVAKIGWKGQGLFCITWETEDGKGRNHYLHGDPPFAWTDYANWTAQ